MGKKTKKVAPFGVNICSCCDKVILTFGQQEHGGIRYCRDCFQATLAWIQIGEKGQKGMLALFDKLGRRKDVQRSLARLSSFSEEDRKLIGLGEAKYRVMMSDIEEANKP